jgi:hypothetical protein
MDDPEDVAIEDLEREPEQKPIQLLQNQKWKPIQLLQSQLPSSLTWT